MGENAVAQQIVDAAFGVHTTLGRGLLESVYAAAWAYELGKRGLRITRQKGIPVVYEAVRNQTWPCDRGNQGSGDRRTGAQETE
ncbi:MAG: GxxExxY protein [Bryobacterales bacterium]|nr:GxxExxY protein [Bryobacterales bacterium]